MDQPTRPRAAGDPAIHAILVRVATLRGDDLVTLARTYEAACLAGRDRVDRRRVIDLARRRAQRQQELRDLEAAVSAALVEATTGRERRSLLRLGILDTAEQAILEAVLAIALRDRLGAEIAAALGEPWEAVA
jgi:hypothetical protein